MRSALKPLVLISSTCTALRSFAPKTRITLLKTLRAVGPTDCESHRPFKHCTRRHTIQSLESWLLLLIWVWRLIVCKAGDLRTLLINVFNAILKWKDDSVLRNLCSGHQLEASEITQKCGVLILRALFKESSCFDTTKYEVLKLFHRFWLGLIS